MIFKPIIPIWAMTVICVLFLVMKRKGKLNYIRQILIVLLMFVINLRPIEPGLNSQSELNVNVDVLFVVDNTMSMLAEDYNGDGRRIDAVKADCKYIIEQLQGASFSVVTFDNKVSLVTPYTIDTNITAQVIDVLNGQTKLYAEGTSINKVLEEMNGFLDNERNACQVVFFISDGEITQKNDDLDKFSQLGKFVDGGAVLGYGTKAGGPMKVQYTSFSEDEEEYLYYFDDDYNSVMAISKLDEGNLKSIASDLGIDYVHMTDRSQIDGVLKDLRRMVSPTGDGGFGSAVGGDREYYFYFVIPLVVLLVYDFIYYRRRIFRKEK